VKLVGAAALLLAVLLAGIAATSWLAVRATRARAAEVEQSRRARMRFEEVRKLANVFLFEFDEEIEHLAGSLAARQLIVRTGLEYLDSLAAEARDDHELRVDVAAGYVRLGDIQGGQMRSNLGDTPGALASYAKAVELLEAQPAGPGAPWRARTTLVAGYRRLAGAYQDVNRGDEAIEVLAQAEAVAGGMLSERPGDPEAADLLAAVLEKAAVAHRSRGDPARGLADLRRAHALRESLSRGAPHDADRQRSAAVTLFQMAMFEIAAGEHETALADFSRFLGIAEALAAAHPDHQLYQRDVRVGNERVGDCLHALGRTEEALASYQRALALAETGLAAAPDDADALASVVAEACHVGEMQLALGRLDEALASFNRQLEAAQVRAGADPVNAYAQRELGVALYKMGEFQAAAARKEVDPAAAASRGREARAWFGRCHDTFRDIRDRGLLWPSDAGVLDDIAAEIDRCDAALAEPRTG
jgi:tetratricopeptide (TPR) repeat protein